ncbi:MAG: (d)CMP kinase [Fretibacterium sp.]|nr:(d)CMP kinase [Fretibacterium sp.]
MTSNFVVTIDGPAGAGKSSVAKRLAERLNLRYLDTGAIYRAVAFILHRSGIEPKETSRLQETLGELRVCLSEEGVFVGEENVTAAIRSPEVDRIVSAYSALRSVRKALLFLQREQLKYGALVVEGRDVGSVVFPDAPLKLFVTASDEVRALRRFLELQRKGDSISFDEVLETIRKRDRIDSTREIAPLTVPDDAIHLDTSDMTEDEVLDKLTLLAKAAMEGRGEGE